MILATDPDCDRMGGSRAAGSGAERSMENVNGNQLSSLLADFVLSIVDRRSNSPRNITSSRRLSRRRS